MAIVYIPSMLLVLTGGERQIEVSGATVREIVENLERAYPGIKERFVEGDRLRHSISVAVNGEVSPLGLLERVEPGSEVHFLAAIRGGK